MVLAPDGGLDVLISPGVRAKLQELAKQVTPCGARVRARAKRFRKRQAACGLKQFQQLVADNTELRETFTDQLTDQIHQQVDRLPNAQDDPNWQGDGGADNDSGYGGSEDGSEHAGEPQTPFDNDDEGFFEGETGEPGSTAGDTVEAIVISTEEEAAAIAAGQVAPGAGAGAGAGAAGAGVTASSFLATIWGSLGGEGNSLEPVYKIPKERIHKITSSKTKSDKHTSTSSSSACPAGTQLVSNSAYLPSMLVNSHVANKPRSPSAARIVSQRPGNSVLPPKQPTPRGPWSNGLVPR